MNMLPLFVTMSGPWGYLLSGLGLVVLVLSGRALWLFGKGGEAAIRLVREQANAILFWGVASAVLGFLGQCYSTYLALGAIIAASEIDPRIVAEGFAISFYPTLFGLAILVYSVLAWVSLRLPFRGMAA